MTHSLFADQGDGRDRIGEEQEKQPVSDRKKAVARLGGRSWDVLEGKRRKGGYPPLGGSHLSGE
jgi:hypothetical protein